MPFSVCAGKTEHIKLRHTLAAAAAASLVALGAPPAWASTPGWRAVPLATSFGGTVNDVSALGPSSAWAVGLDIANDPIVLHWNGRAWSFARTTGLPIGAGLRAVDARSDRDILADGSDPATLYDVVYRFNGSRWTRLPRPRATEGGYATYNAFFGPGGQVWAVASVRGRMAFFRLTATGWRIYRTDVMGGVLSSFDPLFVTRDDAWVAGSTWDVPSQHDRPWLVHFNGRSWSRVAVPPLPRAAVSATLDGIEAVRADHGDRLWLAGNWLPCSPLDGNCASTPFVVSGGGTRWTRERLPARVTAVSGLSPGRSGLPQWMVATTSDYASSYYLRYASGAWALVRGVTIARHQTPNMTIAHIPGTDSTWAVGDDQCGPTPLSLCPRIELNGNLPR
jgi:hypothetical protein